MGNAAQFEYPVFEFFEYPAWAAGGGLQMAQTAAPASLPHSQTPSNSEKIREIREVLARTSFPPGL